MSRHGYRREKRAGHLRDAWNSSDLPTDVLVEDAEGHVGDIGLHHGQVRTAAGSHRAKRLDKAVGDCHQGHDEAQSNADAQYREQRADSPPQEVAPDHAERPLSRLMPRTLPSREDWKAVSFMKTLLIRRLVPDCPNVSTLR